MVRLAPGVDVAAFRRAPAANPSPAANVTRARPGTRRPTRARGRTVFGNGWACAGAPVVVCVSRLVRRKGQDTLHPCSPGVRAAIPGARLLLVGDGPYGPDLRRLAAGLGVADAITFTGSVPAGELPGYYAAGDVFAMPCRTRRGGLDIEGLGIVYLEASAAGLPVIGGDSGGAPDAILDGETGYVVPGRSVTALTERITGLLADPARAQAMGRRGLAWAEQEWDWSRVASRLDVILRGDDALDGGQAAVPGLAGVQRWKAGKLSA